MIYFWADTHYNHRGIIDYASRGDASVREMNDRLLTTWNQVVREKDTIYLLGDFAFYGGKDNDTDDLEGIFHRLRGHKHLVIGNHDERNPKVLKLPWDSQQKLGRVKSEGMRAVICHYPLETWQGAANGSLMLHGHCHGNLKHVIPHRFDVGVDVIPYPISFEELWEASKRQVWEPVDHHGEQ